MCEILTKMVHKLEALTTHHISIFQALDLLEATAHNNDEIIVINVMRESFFELLLEEQLQKSA